MKTDNDIICQVKNLTFSYSDFPLFDQSNFDFHAGINLVLGGDGKGKSSLLKLLAGVLHAHTGQLLIHGTSLQEQPDAYRKQVFWIDPASDMFDHMTALEFFASLSASYPGFDADQIPQLAEGMGLTLHLHKQLFMLSTGSKRKVWLAAAFAANAPVSLLDDPFAALDKNSIQFIQSLLKQAADDPSRTWILAMYTEPTGVPLKNTINLGD
ncbi:ABC transporter ATP-binding protein [Undibacterium sp. SXout7W]|uniref:ABC transporter ATP-binding protein n=1 Tax=Undibacterium sp. SXout7W TaxID=3413049 RepID=UPI003BF444CC